MSPPSIIIVMESDWPQSLPVRFYDGLAEFNRREYFQCHETLESLWLAERGTVREMYQGVIQIAVGCFHLTARGNAIGAVRLLDAGARRIERAGPSDAQYGVDWLALIKAADRLRAHVKDLPLDRIAEYDRSLPPMIRYAPPALLTSL